MDTDKTERHSHCALCGKRLSQKTDTGNIHWQPSHIDDKGLYCDDCYGKKGKDKSAKKRKG